MNAAEATPKNGQAKPSDSDYEVRPPHSIEEFQRVAAVMRQVFDLPARAAPPGWLMEDTTKAGGVTLALLKGGAIVGFSYGLVGVEQEGTYLYSVASGVLVAHRNNHLALEIKRQQREHAISRGYRKATWTFSALRAVNAHLFLTRLGALSRRYLVDTRGSLDREWRTEGGIPIDEFGVEWWLESERVQRRLAGERPSMALDQLRCLTRCQPGKDGVVLSGVDDLQNQERVRFEIPLDFQTMVDVAPELASDWRQQTRPAFTALTDAGYWLTECIRDQDRSNLVFDRTIETPNS